jgi:hypothetical protein
LGWLSSPCACQIDGTNCVKVTELDLTEDGDIFEPEGFGMVEEFGLEIIQMSVDEFLIVHLVVSNDQHPLQLSSNHDIGGGTEQPKIVDE